MAIHITLKYFVYIARGVRSLPDIYHKRHVSVLLGILAFIFKSAKLIVLEVDLSKTVVVYPDQGIMRSKVTCVAILCDLMRRQSSSISFSQTNYGDSSLLLCNLE
jgi:hypothetical protein